MEREEQEFPETIDEKDLYEDIDEEEMMELVEIERKKYFHDEKTTSSKSPSFPRWAFWLIAAMLLLNVAAAIPKTFSIPAVEFLITSAKLSQNEKIDVYQKSVVVIESESSKGTGFSISKDGYIMTNYHVVKGHRQLTVAFPNDGLFDGKVIETYPDIDLAIVKVEGTNLPHLTLAEDTTFIKDEHVYFIGNPLAFNGIANEGKVIGYTHVASKKDDMLMLDAPVYHGNSGSPVINHEGKVIAVVYATLDSNEHGRVGLAIPISYYHREAN